MTVLSSKVEAPQSAPGSSRLRVMLMLEIRDGAEQKFLDAYEEICHKVADVPGHISDQLCQSIQNPSHWLITSEWESAEPYLSWVNSAEHVRMVEPMHDCVYGTRSLRYGIVRETRTPSADGGRPRACAPAGQALGTADGTGAPAAGPMVRHALTFTVKPGSEQAVAQILAGYTSPAAQVDSLTRLHRTSLFMHGNRVVRAIEVVGELGAALRHVAGQPGVRAAEEALNPHLEEARDLDDPQSARAFFMRAALPAVHHITADGATPDEGERRALTYPARPGCGAAVARWLARQDELVAARPSSPLVSSTVFQRDDIVVRLVTLRSPQHADPAVVLGVAGRHAPAVLSRLVDLGRSGDLSTRAGIKRFLADCDMDLVTDRQAQQD